MNFYKFLTIVILSFTLLSHAEESKARACVLKAPKGLPVPPDDFIPIASYTMRFPQEEGDMWANGYDLQLARLKNKVVGVLEGPNLGGEGGSPTALIEDAKLDSKTGHLSFETKNTYFMQDMNPLNKDARASFEGTLSPKTVFGTFLIPAESIKHTVTLKLNHDWSAFKPRPLKDYQDGRGDIYYVQSFWSTFNQLNFIRDCLAK
jgi:hypothetical protein